MGITPIALQGPRFPDLLEPVWSTFLELSYTRGQGYSSPMPISYQEIKAWCDLTGVTLSPWEVDIIKRLDTVYIKVVANGRS